MATQNHKGKIALITGATVCRAKLSHCQAGGAPLGVRKAMQGSKVNPLLFSLEFSDMSGPLAQFQAKSSMRKAWQKW
jgi:hypothetical protein